MHKYINKTQKTQTNKWNIYIAKKIKKKSNKQTEKHNTSLLQVFSGLISFCHIFFSSSPVSTPIFSSIPLLGLVPSLFFQILSPLLSHSPFILSKFSLFYCVFCFGPQPIQRDPPQTHHCISR